MKPNKSIEWLLFSAITSRIWLIAKISKNLNTFQTTQLKASHLKEKSTNKNVEILENLGTNLIQKYLAKYWLIIEVIDNFFFIVFCETESTQFIRHIFQYRFIKQIAAVI